MNRADLPLEELHRYAGTNPRPDDFDAYWKRALAEEAAGDPRVERRPAAFSSRSAVCEELFFDGVGGARVHAKLLLPRGASGPVPAVLRFHGYTASSGDWAALLPFAAEGLAVLAMDVRGQGGESTDPGGVAGTTFGGHIVRGLEDHEDKLFFRNVFLDTARLARVAASLEEIDGDRLGSAGGSQGGALALACAALAPVRRCSAAYPFLCDYRRVWEMDLARRAYQELTDFFRRRDPTHARADHWFNRLGYIDVQHLAPRVNADVLMAVGQSDLTCPPSTQFAAYNKLPGEKEVVVYPDHGHEVLPGWADRELAFLSELRSGADD